VWAKLAKLNAVKKEMTRISVALDEKIERMLDTLVKEEDKTVSEIIRAAITTYFELKTSRNKLDIGKLKRYGELLYGEEHVLVDIELWITILDEMSKRESEEFIECIKRIGYNQGIQNKNMGLNDIYDSLKYLEVKNWFKVKTNGKTCTIVLSTRSEQNILRIFLENMFKAQGIPVEIIGGLRKLTVVKKENQQTSA
jgi:Arc/MetJ-type ribon-helix-helix transcriptional regulator